MSTCLSGWPLWPGAKENRSVSLQNLLEVRASNVCELCGATEGLSALAVPPKTADEVDNCVLGCDKCSAEVQSAEAPDAHHWRCLNESAWSAVPAVQVVSWRMLTRLSDEAWARDLLDMIYLDDDAQAWAQEGEESAATTNHRDSNGAVLTAGDSVTLIKDLNVKGANFTAKRGTMVRGISLVHDNEAQIEGRISGQQIVILTAFVKKA